MRSLATCITTILLLIVSACVQTPTPDTTPELAIIGAKIYTAPDAPALTNTTIILRNGKIAALGPAASTRPDANAKIIDGANLVVTAGFWNSHVHLISPTMSKSPAENAAALEAELTAMLTSRGFTTVFDIASLPGQAIALRKRIEAGEIRGPNILTVDAPFYPNNGVPIYARDLMKGQPSFEIGTPAQAAARAQAQIAAGADGVKIFAGSIVGPPTGVLPMPLADAKAVVEAAHRAGKPAFAHPSNTAGLEIAIESGADILAHTTPDNGQTWPPELVARIKAHNMALIPTMTLWLTALKQDNVPDDVIARFVAVAQQQLKAYSDAGGQILFGTDVGFTDAFDTTDEYRQMSAAGLTWTQILTSLTTAPAERFQHPTKGRLAKGLDADITVLAADPATDATAFANVAYTIRAGEVIYEAKR